MSDEPTIIPMFAPGLGGGIITPGSGNAPALPPRQGSCRFCHRPLTSPDSIAAGMGPVCAAAGGRRYDGITGPFKVAGNRGVTSDSVTALEKLLRNDRPRGTKPRFYVVSYDQWSDPTPATEQTSWWHGLIVEANGKLNVVSDGFASGYNGEGPRGLVRAMELLREHGLEAAGSILLDEAHAAQLFTGHMDPGSLIGIASAFELSVAPDGAHRATFRVTPEGLHRLLVRPLPRLNPMLPERGHG